jgi:CRISPR-associated protein (TIGR02584 family)
LPRKPLSRARKPKGEPVPRGPSQAEPEVILLAVTGMSPAVLTETVWALAHEKPPVLPKRIIVLTTSQGSQEIQRQLFQPDPRLNGRCPWEALRATLADAGLDVGQRLRFGTTADDIRVITGVDASSNQSCELADLRTREDNRAAADFILSQVRAITANPDTHLVASLAGGRKTMGALLYACLTLVGRESDRLTHVLVSEPYETLRGFYFPGQGEGPLQDRDGRAHHPAAAQVELADVPFVPLSNLFTQQLGRAAGSFEGLVLLCSENVRKRVGESVQLTICQSRTELVVNGTIVRPSPREHLVLLFLATRRKRGEGGFAMYKEALAPLNAFREELVRQASVTNLADWRRGEALQAKFDETDDQDLRRAISGLRNRLYRAGGNAPSLAGCLPAKGRCSLEVSDALIHIKD